MKKIGLILGLLSINLLAHNHMNSLPDGDWEGTGYWSDSLGGHGRYDVDLAFHGDHIHGDYFFYGAPVILDLDFLFGPDGWFQVGFLGQVVGKGFCLEDECMYDMTINDTRINEVLKFSDDCLHRIGYKELPDRVVRWEEKLDDTHKINEGK